MDNNMVKTIVTGILATFGIGCTTVVICKAIDKDYSVSVGYKDANLSLSKPSNRNNTDKS